MKIPAVSFLLLSVWAMPLVAQQKVAEGEYANLKITKNGDMIGRTETKWTLYRSPSGYYVESEVRGGRNGPRYVQSEDLDETMVPISMSYSVYANDGESMAMRCDFVGETITCSARPVQREEFAQSKPFKHHGPFLLLLGGAFAIDINWLVAGAINMAHLDAGKTSIATVSVDGGLDVEWYFSDKETDALEFAGVDFVEIEGRQVSAKHFLFGNGEKPHNLWMAGPGIVVKSTSPSSCDGCGDILVHYKQYQKLIPELPVEPAPKDAGSTK